MGGEGGGDFQTVIDDVGGSRGGGGNFQTVIDDVGKIFIHSVF